MPKFANILDSNKRHRNQFSRFVYFVELWPCSCFIRIFKQPWKQNNKERSITRILVCCLLNCAQLVYSQRCLKFICILIKNLFNSFYNLNPLTPATFYSLQQWSQCKCLFYFGENLAEFITAIQQNRFFDNDRNYLWYCFDNLGTVYGCRKTIKKIDRRIERIDAEHCQRNSWYDLWGKWWNSLDLVYWHYCVDVFNERNAIRIQ